MTPPRGCEAPTASGRVGFEVAWTTRTTERSRAGPRTSSGCGASCSRRAAGARAAAADRGHQQRCLDSRRPRPRSRGTAPRHLIATTARTWKPGVSRRFLSGSDGTRTRDLRRDRTAVDVIPSSLPQGQVFRNWERRHGRHRHAEAANCSLRRQAGTLAARRAGARPRPIHTGLPHIGHRDLLGLNTCPDGTGGAGAAANCNWLNEPANDRFHHCNELRRAAPCGDRPARSPYPQQAARVRSTQRPALHALGARACVLRPTPGSALVPIASGARPDETGCRSCQGGRR